MTPPPTGSLGRGRWHGCGQALPGVGASGIEYPDGATVSCRAFSHDPSETYCLRAVFTWSTRAVLPF
jgi:hypothetical protein